MHPIFCGLSFSYIMADIVSQGFQAQKSLIGVKSERLLQCGSMQIYFPQSNLYKPPGFLKNGGFSLILAAFCQKWRSFCKIISQGAFFIAFCAQITITPPPPYRPIQLVLRPLIHLVCLLLTIWSNDTQCMYHLHLSMVESKLMTQYSVNY